VITTGDGSSFPTAARLASLTNGMEASEEEAKRGSAHMMTNQCSFVGARQSPSVISRSVRCTVLDIDIDEI
jgi:hypothetical protein